jgi:hypothetical protein
MSPTAVLPDLLHGSETRLWGDQAYRGQRAVIRLHAPRAQHFTNRRYRYRGGVNERERAKSRTKSKVRAKLEHPIRVIKRVFGFVKVALSRPQKEHPSPARDPRARQSLHGTPASAALSGGVRRAHQCVRNRPANRVDTAMPHQNGTTTP